MINQGVNILDEHSKHHLIFDANLKQINFADRRVYKREEGLYYPSITSILEYMPKSKFFENWMKDVGHNADIILQKAGKEGTQVHEAIEHLVKGEEISWLDNFGNAKYNEVVWSMLIKFHNFWTTYSPELILIEELVYSDKYRYAGTLDLVLKLGDKTWLIDIKTGNALYKSHDLQVAAYVKALEEIKEIKVDKGGILWLKSLTRGTSNKKGVYQGAGWQLKEIEDVEKDFKLFQTVYEFYLTENPTTEPLYNTYPVTLKI